MKAEYIQKQDALDAFGLSKKTRKYGGDHSGYDTRMLYEIQDTIESLKPADVVQVVHGKWIEEWWHGEKTRKCSVCNLTQTVNTYKGEVKFKYCPYCGAKMDGEE